MKIAHCYKIKFVCSTSFSNERLKRSRVKKKRFVSELFYTGKTISSRSGNIDRLITNAGIMNSSTSIITSMRIDSIKHVLLSSIGIFYIIFGTIGNVSNIILFIRPTIWSHSACIPYLLASSIANIFIIYTTILLRTLIGFRISPTYHSRIACKLLIYISNVSNVLSTWFMVGSCYDRYLSSSIDATVRLRSNRRTTSRIIWIIIFVESIHYIQTLLCYDIRNGKVSVPCASKNTLCSIIEITTGFFFQFIAPLILLMYFGIRTFLNVKRRRRLHRLNNRSNACTTVSRVSIRNDQHILRVVFTQATICLICTLPLLSFGIYQLTYTTFIKSNLSRSVENLLFNLALLLYTFDKVCSFYISTLSSIYFRSEFKRIIYSSFRRSRVIYQV